jgi:hypothetical protein
MKTKAILLTSTIAILSLATPIYQAYANTKISPAPVDNTPAAKLALYQSTEVICGNGSTTYARAETKGYYVNICGDASGPNSYLGAGKSGQAIVLPLQNYSPGKYVAASGNIRYILTSNYLTVTQSGRTILKQKVIYWR